MYLMLTTVKFAKVRENAIIPSKRDEDAGFDIYPCFDEDYIVIQPNETKLIPTGICSAFDKDYVFILKERGSTGTKGMGQRAGVMDSGFRGEWWTPITNHTNSIIVIGDEEKYKADSSKETFSMLFGSVLNNWNGTIYYPKTKAICQALLVPVPEVEVEEYTYEEIQNIKSERMGGMIGSSGK